MTALRAGAVVAALSLVNQGFVLALQAWVARRHGADGSVDAWFAAQALPAIVAIAVAAIAGQSLLPLLARARERGEAPFRALAGSALGAFGLLTFIAGAGLAIAAAPLVAWVTPGAPSTTHAEAATLLRWLALGTAALGVASAGAQVAYARSRFVAIACWAPAGAVLQLVAFALAPPEAALRWMIIAQSFAGVGGALVALTAAGPVGSVMPRPTLLRPLARGAGTILLVAACFRVNQAVDTAFASTLAVGSLAALGYASRVVAILQAVLTAPIASVVFASLSGFAARGESGAFAGAAQSSSERLLVLSIGAAAVLAGLGEPAARLLLGPEHATGAAREIGTCFVALSGLLVCGAWGGLLTRVCLAAGEWRTLRWYQGWLPMCSNLVLDALLVSRFGVAGLAAVTSLNALIGLPLLERALLRRGVLRSSTLPGLARNALAGTLVAVALRQLPAPPDGPALVAFLVASAIGGVLSYAALVATGSWLGGSRRPWRSADGV